MLTRRQLMTRGLKTSPLLALATTAPDFVARTAHAAAPKSDKDTVLVVLEMTGGNDGLNTAVPYEDDRYHKARPTLRLTKQQVLRVDDKLGLHPGLRSLERLLKDGQIAVVQGVGYPNPDRSHFESMDIWQSADIKRQIRTGWLGRSLGEMKFQAGAIPGMYVGTERMPLALAGAPTAVPSVHNSRSYDLELSTNLLPGPPNEEVPFRVAPFPAPGDPSYKARRDLLRDLAELPQGPPGDLAPFVQRNHLQTYANIERLRKIMEEQSRAGRSGRGLPGNPEAGSLGRDLSLVAGLINADFGTRVFYLSIGGFDTHADQARQQETLFQQIGSSVASFFEQLQQAGNANRVLLMTYSEFGRRVSENGSRGTDHGSGSCLFVMGPGVKGGPVGEHPKLDDLANGDLKFHTDFRCVYATLLNGWLGFDSRAVLGAKFDTIPLLKQG